MVAGIRQQRLAGGRHPAEALETVIGQIVAINVGVARIASSVGEVMSVTIVLLVVMQDTWLVNAIEIRTGVVAWATADDYSHGTWNSRQ